MKTLVNGISAAVRRSPIVVIVITVLVSLALGAAGGQFAPEEDSNESFAPEAPELLAVETISDLFGSDSSESVMQVIIRSESGDAITADGLEAAAAIEETVRAGVLGEVLADRPDEERPAVVSFLYPVQAAIAQGQADPGLGDQELKLVYGNSLQQLPPEQAGFASALLPTDVDPQSGISDLGLMIIFSQGPESTDAFDAFVDRSAAAAQEIRETDLPQGLTAEPFAFELLFADDSEFQDEVLRMLVAALFIIVTVLALVFFIAPRRRSRRVMGVGGFAALIAVTLGLVLEVAQVAVVLAVFGLVLFLWALLSKTLRRTTADTLLTIVTIFFAISWMNGLGYLLFRDQNPMVQIIPILLIGLGVDYSIHLLSRYREELTWGQDADQAIAIGIKTVGVALILATVTTSVGFLTNVFNDIPALREFGVLAAVGITASFILMLTFVPAVRVLLDRRGDRVESLDRTLLRSSEARLLPMLSRKTSWLAKKAPVVVVIVSLVLGALGAYGVTKLEARFSFLDFVPTTSPVRGTFETLLDRFSGGFGERTQVLLEGDVATAEAWNAMVEANANMVDTPNVVLFAGNPAAGSPLSVIAQLIIPDSPTFDQSVADAAGAAEIDQGLQVAPGGDIAAVYEAAFAAAPDQMGAVIHSDGSGGYDAALFDITTQAGEDGAGQLRVDLATDFTPVTAFGISAVATSDEIVSDVIVTTLRDSQVSSLLYTLVAALILLILNFWFEARRPMLGVVTTIPVVLVVVWGFSIMALTGIPFGPITATVAALSVGIGIPYMIHITHRYLEDGRRCDTVDEAVESTLGHTGGALAGSALTTIAGFGILMTSTTIPFRQFGFVTAYTIGLALLAAILILPSMLVLWDRYHRRRGEIPIDAEAVEAALQLGGSD